ncbi:hypothetical protein MAP00_008734 [Monascus purpureus]|nr:hypothetical protein MAP00_008734 [Monascus purpureus]
MLPIIIIAAFTLTFLTLQYLHNLHYHRKRSKALHCKPITRGDDVFFGILAFIHMQRAVKQKRFLEYQISRFENFGRNTFTFTIFGKRIVATREPENIKAMLATQFQDFCLGDRYKQFHPFLGDGIFTLDGKGWSKARTLLRPQFVKDQVADLALMDDHITRLIELVPKDKSTFDIQRLFFLLTIDSATHFLFGESIGSMLPPSTSRQGILETSAVGSPQGFAEAFNLSQEYLTHRARAANLYWLVDTREFRESNRKIHEVVDYYVKLGIEKYSQKQNQKSEMDEKEKERYVFLQALVADTQDPKMLRDNLLNILLAGRDTTASLLSSAFYYLARHREVWDRLRREVIDVFGDAKHPKAEITHAGLKDIAYLRYVLNETLRLLPPVPVNFRVATKDTSLPAGGGEDEKSPIYVRKGTQVAYSVYAMHRRPDLWGEDANTFRPERWEENAKHGWEYLPFNGGPRICLGQQYALTEASYALVRLLQHFDTVENGDDVLGDNEDPILEANLTLSHVRGVWVRLYSKD